MGNEPDFNRRKSIFNKIKEEMKEKKIINKEKFREKKESLKEKFREKKESLKEKLRIMKEHRKKNIKIFKESIKRKLKNSEDNRPQIERRMTYQQENLQNINNQMEEEIEEDISNHINENIENNISQSHYIDIYNNNIYNNIINNNIIDNNISNLLEEIEITEDIINKADIKECPICLEEFNNKIPEKIPKILKCGDTLCSKCLRDLYLSEKMACPICKKEINVHYLIN